MLVYFHITSYGTHYPPFIDWAGSPSLSTREREGHFEIDHCRHFITVLWHPKWLRRVIILWSGCLITISFLFIIFCPFPWFYFFLHFERNVFYIVSISCFTDQVCVFRIVNSLFNSWSWKIPYLFSGFFPGVARGILYTSMMLSFRFRKVLVQVRRCNATHVGPTLCNSQRLILGLLRKSLLQMEISIYYFKSFSPPN